MAHYKGNEAAQGTKLAGYEEHGPYHCEDCLHQDGGLCSHPAIMADPELEDRRNEDGFVQINLERGCCEYVNQPLEDEDEEPEGKQSRVGRAEKMFKGEEEGEE